MRSSLFVCATACGLSFFVSGAEAQQIVSTTRDYTLSYSGLDFTTASAAVGASLAYGAQAPFSTTFTIGVPSGAENFTLSDSGGITISATPPYTGSLPVNVTSDGTAGAWGWNYTDAANNSFLTVGVVNGHHLLTFDGGGSLIGPDANGAGYYVNVYVPGDWTTLGTAMGDLNIIGVAGGFSNPTASYSGGQTLISTYAANNPQVPVNLNFQLIGYAAPEPSTWAMLIAGFAGLSLAGYRKARRAPIAA